MAIDTTYVPDKVITGMEYLFQKLSQQNYYLVTNPVAEDIVQRFEHIDIEIN